MEHVLRHGNRYEYGAMLLTTAGRTDVDKPAHPSISTRDMAVRVMQVPLSKMTDALSCLSSFERQIFRWVVRQYLGITDKYGHAR